VHFSALFFRHVSPQASPRGQALQHMSLANETENEAARVNNNIALGTLMFIVYCLLQREMKNQQFDVGVTDRTNRRRGKDLFEVIFNPYVFATLVQLKASHRNANWHVVASYCFLIIILLLIYYSIVILDSLFFIIIILLFYYISLLFYYYNLQKY
jgi:hypothetical protein